MLLSAFLEMSSAAAGAQIHLKFCSIFAILLHQHLVASLLQLVLTRTCAVADSVVLAVAATGLHTGWSIMFPQAVRHH